MRSGASDNLGTLIQDCTNGLDGDVLSYIDNVLFVANSQEDVRIAAKRFLDRCQTIGAQINNPSIVVEQRFDFLGEHYDLAKGTRSLTDKTQNKLGVVSRYIAKQLLTANPNCDTGLTKREFAAIVGLLIFSSRVVDTALCYHYWALRTYREVASQTHSDQWSCKLGPLPRQKVRNFAEWITSVQKQQPDPISSLSGADDAVLFVDASTKGWGAVAIYGDTVLVADMAPGYAQ